jgi:hypothetical protein
MDPDSILNWPEQNKRKPPFDTAQKTWLDEQRPQYLKRKAEGSSGQVIAHEISIDMDGQWPVTFTEEVLAKCKTEDKAKIWAHRSRGQVSQG